ncbi:MAG: hypothetical protein KDK56_01875 [Simkania sp.]|nr:hypothetical protein [Simkania sp.]
MTHSVQQAPSYSETTVATQAGASAVEARSFAVGDLVKILFATIGNALWFIPSLMIRSISDWTSSSIQMDQQTGVPVALHDLLKIVEEKAKSTEGVYRKAASLNQLNALTQQVSQGKTGGIKGEMDAHLAACSVKKILREMPDEEKVFPAAIPNLEEMGEDQKLPAVKSVIGSLTPQKKAFLTHMLNHIETVSEYSAVNKMTKSNLALTLMPNLIPQSTDPLEMLAGQTQQNAFFMFIVENRTALDI